MGTSCCLPLQPWEPARRVRRDVLVKERAARGRHPRDLEEGDEVIPSDVFHTMLAAAETAKARGRHVYVVGQDGSGRLRLASAQRKPCVGDIVRVTALRPDNAAFSRAHLGKLGRITRANERSEHEQSYRVEGLGLTWFQDVELEVLDKQDDCDSCAGSTRCGSCTSSCASPSSGSSVCGP